MRIDVHTHFYTKEYVEGIRKFDSDKGSQITGIKFSVWTSAEERIERMDKHGIDMEILLLSAPKVYLSDRSLCLSLVQGTNDLLSHLSKKFPDRFLGVASLLIVEMGDTLLELHRAVERPGLRGVVLGSNINDKRPDAPEFEPLFAEMEKMGQPVFVHPMPPADGFSSYEYKLTAILSLPFETTVCVTRMINAAVFERHPGLQLVLPHLGGTLPFLFTRIDLGYKSYRECREKLSKPPSYFLKNFYYDTAVSFGKPTLLCTAELVGLDHIIFGTDYPFQRDPADTIVALESLQIEPHQRKTIFSENANILFRPEV